jgi:hypothetical protein
LALVHDFSRAIVAASNGAKRWREDCKEGFGLRTVLFFRPDDGTEKFIPGFERSDWSGSGFSADDDWLVWVLLVPERGFWFDETAGDLKIWSLAVFDWLRLVFAFLSDISPRLP